MIRTQRAHLNVEAHTHPGMTGKNNEDRYGVASFVTNAQERTPVVFAVLADGIGGHRGGEVAALRARVAAACGRRESHPQALSGLSPASSSAAR